MKIKNINQLKVMSIRSYCDKNTSTRPQVINPKKDRKAMELFTYLQKKNNMVSENESKLSAFRHMTLRAKIKKKRKQ